MLKVTSIVKSKNGWESEHIVNICYSLIENAEESDKLSALRGESFASSTRFKDGARLEGLASSLFVEETDSEGKSVKRSILEANTTDGKRNWDAILDAVNTEFSGVIDSNAFGVSVPASVIYGEENVIAFVTKAGLEIPNIPVIYRGENGKEAAIAKMQARWKQRVSKGLATVKRSATAAE